MSTLTDKFAKLPTTKLPTVKFLNVDVNEAKKPLFAAVGVADLAIEQIKDAPAVYVTEAKKAQARVEAAYTTVPAQLKTLPAQVKGLRTDAQARLVKAQGSATDFYAQLAVRGEKLVTQIRRQPATEAAIAEGKAAVKKAEATTTAAKRTAKAAEKAVEDASANVGE